MICYVLVTLPHLRNRRYSPFSTPDTNVSNSLDAEYHLDLDEVRTALNTDLDSMIQIINSFDTFLRRFMKL